MRRLRGSFRPGLQDDIDDELRFHLEARLDECVRFALFASQTWGGMPRTMNYEDVPGRCPVPPYTGVGNVATRVAWS